MITWCLCFLEIYSAIPTTNFEVQIKSLENTAFLSVVSMRSEKSNKSAQNTTTGPNRSNGPLLLLLFPLSQQTLLASIR